MFAAPNLAKLSAPQVRHLLPRPRVRACIDLALSRSGCCWLAAPAGYGKTTAAMEVLQAHAGPHAWCRVDEGDQDVASFFHYLALSVPAAQRGHLPTFTPGHAEDVKGFARLFFRAWFGAWPPGALIVLDDLHDADGPLFHLLLITMLQERPPAVSCLLVSRTLPPQALKGMRLDGRLEVIEQRILQFTAPEARALVSERGAPGLHELPVERARGWAAGLVLMAEQADGGALALAEADETTGDAALFDILGHQVFDGLPPQERSILMKLSLLPEVTTALAGAFVDDQSVAPLLERLHERQLLVTWRDDMGRTAFRLHDLLRDFLARRLRATLSPAAQEALSLRAVDALWDAERQEDAIDLCLRAGAWAAAREKIVIRAETLLAQGRRTTVLDWCARIPDAELDAWLCYWRGVASFPDDAEAEAWLERAWARFDEEGCLRGKHLTVARAVLVKTDSWRTHAGLSLWTTRAISLLETPAENLTEDERLLSLVGLLKALDFSNDSRDFAVRAGSAADAVLAALVAEPRRGGANLRLLASAALIEHAGSMNKGSLFAQAVDAVAEELANPDLSRWVLGLWLVAFGAATGRYFTYHRRDFPFADAEQALRAAIDIGERESLRGVEFGALYHVQYQMKLRNEWAELAGVVRRLEAVADSRFTTQVAVLADCQAALHTRNGAVAEAAAACRRFMHAIEAADEPPVERWPHYITRFQARLASGDVDRAAAELREVMPMFEGAMHDRIGACVAIAEAIAAEPESAAYRRALAEALVALRAGDWTAALVNLPDRLADLVGDGLDLGLEPEFCRRLVRERRLLPPPRRPAAWPWRLKIRVLGRFGLEVDGAPFSAGAKPPARAFDILRALAVAKDHTLPVSDLQDWFWPDADGDLAKAACEQALHRLRKLFGERDLILQRQGRLTLAMDKVWIDLDDWERRLAAAASALGRTGPAGLPDLDRLIDEFPGPLLAGEPCGPWSHRAAERLEGAFVDLAVRLAGLREAAGDVPRARALRVRALDVYPGALRLHEAQIRARLARNDTVGAWEDYARWERWRPDDAPAEPGLALRELMRASAPPG